MANFDEKLYEKALRYDPSSDVYPAGYFDVALNYFEKEMFEDLSTTAFDVPCDNHCKRERELMNKLPCEFEDSLGYCSDPKRQRVLKSGIETSGGRFGHPINKQGEESKEKLEDVLEAKNQYTPEETLMQEEEVNRENKLRAEIYENFPELKNIMEKQEKRIPLSARERQIKSRSEKEIKKNKGKYLKD